MSDALVLYQPTSTRKGNTTQFIELAKVATGVDMKKGQAKRAVQEKCNDSTEAQL